MDKIEDKFENMNVSETKKEEVKEDQNHPEVITPEYVMNLQDPTNTFLCKLSDNWPKFKFGGFKIRDMISKITLVDVPDQDDDS